MSDRDPRLDTITSMTDEGPMVVGPAARRVQEIYNGEPRVGMSSSQKWAIRTGCALLIIGASAGGMYYFYTKGLEDGVRLDPPLMVAHETPIKVLPSDPGGKQVPHQDKLVYDQLSGGNVDTQNVIVSEPSEQALPRPTEIQPELAVEDWPHIIEPTSEPAPSNTIFTHSVSAQSPNTSESSEVRASEKGLGVSAPTQVLDHPLKETFEVTENSVRQAADGAPKALFATPDASPLSVEGPDIISSKEQERAGVSAGPFYAQLGSFRNKDDAAREWDRIQKVHSDIFNGLGQTIHSVDLGERGVYHRVLAGGFGTKADAKAVCEALARKNIENCLVNRID